MVELNRKPSPAASGGVHGPLRHRRQDHTHRQPSGTRKAIHGGNFFFMLL